MRSTVGLDVMNSINPELNWKFVTKGRRSRKSVPRSFNGVSKVGKISPKRVGDFSVSDSDKLALSVLGQPKARKSEHVPIKKRRHLLGSPAPLHCQDSLSPQPNSSLQPSENQTPDQFLHSNYSLGKRSLNSHANLQLTGVDGLARAKSNKGFNNVTLSKRAEVENYSGDFSGIELLAAAASMEGCADNANKEDSADNTNKVDCAVEDYSIPGCSDTSIVVSPSKLGLKCNESGNSSSTRTTCADSANCLPVLNKCAATSLSPCVSSKMDRRYWNLNTEIDAWGEPYDDSISGNTSKNSAGCKMHVEGLKVCSEELPNPAVVGNESFALKREDKVGVAPDRTSCTDSTSLEEHLVKPEKISHSSVAGETSNQALRKDVDENNSNQVVRSDADVGTPSQVMSTDANRVFDSVQAMIQDAEIPGAAVSASKIVVPDKNAIDSQNSYKAQGNVTSLRNTISNVTCRREYSHKSNSNPDELNCFSFVSKFGYSSGSFLKDEKCVVADYTVQNVETCVAGSMITESRSQVQPEKLVIKHEDNSLPNEGLGRVMLEDSCNSYSTRPYDDRAASVGKVDNTIDPCPESPYEDGELRGLFLYSWEENELETELVDYESDGRKGESSDAADNIASEIVECGSEGSHGTEVNRVQSNAVKYPLRRNFAKDDSKNNETCGKKESNGGSGSTVEHSMEMVIDENNDSMKRRDFNRTGMDDCKALMGEYVSRMAREKLQSRIEGRSSLEAADGKDAFFLPQYRSRRLGGFRNRDVTPEKHVTPTTCSSGRDGVNQWNNWGSRSRYTSNYQGTEGYNGTRSRRNITGDSVEKFGVLDFHEQRQTADYLSRDMHRPLVRTRSAVERDNRFSMGKKMPPTRRINSYKSSAHYPQSGGFEPTPNGPAAPVRFSRMPRTERSFSPNPVKDGHMPLNRRSYSRSRTRSPRAWHFYGDGNFASKRHSRSPDFRTEARMERVNVPFHKPTFTREYREGYMSPPRGRFSPQRNSRWVDDRNFAENRFKRRRSPTGGFRCNNQSFNSVNSSDRLKADEYFRPVIRPRRFSFVENDVRETKFETNYDDRKLENKGEMYRGKQRDNGGNFKRFQREVINDFETRKSNNEEGVCGTVPRDVPRVQCDREDKKESEI